MKNKLIKLMTARRRTLFNHTSPTDAELSLNTETHQRLTNKLPPEKEKTVDLQKCFKVTCKTDVLLLQTDSGSEQTLSVMIRLPFVQLTLST